MSEPVLARETWIPIIPSFCSAIEKIALDYASTQIDLKIKEKSQNVQDGKGSAGAEGSEG
jgi:hypothetical protein